LRGNPRNDGAAEVVLDARCLAEHGIPIAFEGRDSVEFVDIAALL